MKKDPYFLFLAATLLAGVVLAMACPSPATHPAASPNKVAVNHAPYQGTKS